MSHSTRTLSLRGDVTLLAENRARSVDGTTVSFRSVGTGPGIVIWHGSMESALSHMQLARMLADEFTVHLVDRRGHGQTGGPGPDYGMQREVEDARAVLGETGSTYLFGISAGGLVVLEVARTSPELVQRVAVYEPALLLGDPAKVAWLTRFDQEMAAGKVAAAMVTSMLGLGLAPRVMSAVPRWLLVAATNKALRADDKSAEPGHVTMRELAPTLHNEGVLLKEMDGRLDSFGEVRTPVLLMGGAKGLPYLKPALAGLDRVLVNGRRIEYAGLDHGGASDPSPLNAKGSPATVASDLRDFFRTP